MSKLTVKTAIMQKLLNKVMKGVLDSPLLPITSMLGIKLEDGLLSISAYDKLNYIKVKEEHVVGDNFEITVLAERFNKIIQKTTSEDITLINKVDHLELKGNGNYKLELPIDPSTNDVVKFPNIPQIQGERSAVDLKTIRAVLDYNKLALSRSGDIVARTGYYCADKVMTTNNEIIVLNDVKVLDKPFLASRELFVLLSTLSDETVSILRKDKEIVFVTKDVVIYSMELEEATAFQYDVFLQYVALAPQSSCKLAKALLLDVMDRVSLFINKQDNDVLKFKFTQAGLEVSSKSETGNELIPYAKSTNFGNFECYVIYNYIKEIIAAQKDVTAAEEKREACVELQYGNESVLKIIGDNVQYALALVSEDVVQTQQQEEESLAEIDEISEDLMTEDVMEEAAY
jgi:DNA polymerase III sliding clamp (beta) subunit (PCNA family)